MHRRRPTAMAVLGLWAAVAAGQTAAPAAGAPKATTVTVTGSAAQERVEEAAGKQVIQAQDLARHGDTRLPDALRRVPGLTVSGSGADVQIRLDGMAAEQTLLLVDGEPVPRGQALEALALGMVERIEIVRGANVQWSGRGLAGTINIVTVRAPRTAQRSASVALGSFFGRPTAALELSVGDRAGAARWRVDAAARAERERYPVDQHLRFEDADGRVRSAYRARTVDSAHDDALTLTPQLHWAGADGGRLELSSVLSLSQFAGAGDDQRSELQGEPPRLVDDRLAYTHRRRFGRISAKGSWPLAADTKLAASLMASRGRRVQESLLTGTDAAGIAARDSTVDSTRHDDLLSARSDLQHRLSTAHTLSAGVQLDANRGQEFRLQRERIPSWAPDVTDERYDAASRSLAVFVQDDWLPGRTTTVSVGARVEQLNTRSEGNVFDGVQRRHRLASPMLNLLWRPDTQVQWKLGLSRAFRLPEPRDIMPRRWTRPENSSLVPDFMGNPELKPESAWTLTLGWDRQPAVEGGSRLGVNGMLKRVDDLMLGELLQLDGQYVLRRANFGRAWVASLQAQWQGELQAPWGGAIKLQAGAGARASRLDALPGPDNRLPQQPPRDLSLEADHQPAGSRWALTAAWRWRSAARALAPSARQVEQGPMYGLDLAAAWQQDPATRWRLSVTGLGAADEVETLTRRGSSGDDRLHARTGTASRWRVQWSQRL